ncbi:hypothetical protein BX616_008998 [Lobosporangium transversale]|uniref:VPS9 domain-containing protein n=1 Tax=Lobosporangium transversale TaxID=64571 RepID=A0A1Y2GJB9_9FUNG|nr:hypothetical protein BCR41DRAFT_358848 [Lobosporangium transversale]KAF9914090.1 hypothetical protein BX616_008998 [Lobosporangium transversale]ORZ09081.1 hypothetical protein BCR41DRAFT_358848 [Lobosporangium transversale]|eukprot:XP_021878708.1 hypothetical protein BCR41DRAFT_358848 [Lobosporangium transversale]
MSLKDDESNEQLEEAMHKVAMNSNSNFTTEATSALSTNTATPMAAADAASVSNGQRSSVQDNNENNIKDKDKDKDKDLGAREDNMSKGIAEVKASVKSEKTEDKNKDPTDRIAMAQPLSHDSSISFAEPTSPEPTTTNDESNTTVNSESNITAQPPLVPRRKSSLITIGDRLKRTSSIEKHVTIVDATTTMGDNSTNANTEDRAEELTKEKSQEDEASKKELAKILMQFDPLAESKDQNDDEIAVTVVDRGMSMSKGDVLHPELNALSPNLSSPSPPGTPQELNSPRTSHDVHIAMHEKAKSAEPSTTKKKNESRLKNSSSSSASKTRDRDGTSGSKNNNSARLDREEVPKPKDVPFDFQKFLEQMRHRSAMPITRYFQSFLKEFDKKPWTVNEQVKIIHDFLDFITEKMGMCDLWKDVSDQEFENVKEGMEKLVMNRLFAYTFSPSTTDDAERDEVLTQKIRIFRWIREVHLDIPHSPHNELHLNSAQAELMKINNYKAPRDKVICILNCCKFIFTLIRRAEGNSKGADTFLPILIYVVLRANPPNLVSNVQYISRFRNPEKLQAEAGYYLASLMGAISFIENLEASSLSISPEEFDQQIEKTMTELSQEKAEAMKAGEGTTVNTASSVPAATDGGSSGHRKHDSKLAKLLAGTAATKKSVRQQQSQQQQRQHINEKHYLTTEATHQEKASTSQQQQQQQRMTPSPALSTSSSILNPAAALIERGANFATKTIQKPLDMIERMFQDNGDDEEMAKPYPPRPSQQQLQQGQRPDVDNRNDSLGGFVYVSPDQQPISHSNQQLTLSSQEQQGYPGNPQHQHRQQSMEDYRQNLVALTEMFPSCERQVCDVILQANDGRLSPSIDALLEISSATENKGQPQQQQLQSSPLPSPSERPHSDLDTTQNQDQQLSEPGIQPDVSIDMQEK